MNTESKVKLLEKKWDNKKCGLGRQNWIRLQALELKEEIYDEIKSTISPEEMNMTFKPYYELQKLLKRLDVISVNDVKDKENDQ